MLSPAHILIVDDLPENLLALEALIRRSGVVVHQARSADEALSELLSQDFALAILDVQMPGTNGFELAELMRGTERTRHIPIVFVSAAGREQNYDFHGYESGAVDFLHKPLDPHTVRSKVTVFVDLWRQRRAVRMQLEALEAARRQQEVLLDELRRTQEELHKAVRMRDDFMSMVSHELRTPLNTLALEAQLRRNHLSRNRLEAFAPDKLQAMVERDERQVQSMVRLIDDMLDVTRLQRGTLSMLPRPFDLAELLRRTVRNFAQQAEAAACPTAVQAPAGLLVELDEFRIEQVLANLLTNAFRYGPGAPVEVSLHVADGQNHAGETAEAGDAVMTDQPPPAQTSLRIDVTDHGKGIAEADQTRIFQQFERASDNQVSAGLGLGLFIVQQIVEAHGGRITLRSALGKGSTFSVHLPRVARPQAAVN